MAHQARSGTIPRRIATATGRWTCWVSHRSQTFPFQSRQLQCFWLWEQHCPSRRSIAQPNTQKTPLGTPRKRPFIELTVVQHLLPSLNCGGRIARRAQDEVVSALRDRHVDAPSGCDETASVKSPRRVGSRGQQVPPQPESRLAKVGLVVSGCSESVRIEGRRAGSNRQPQRCKRGALPIELRPRNHGRRSIRTRATTFYARPEQKTHSCSPQVCSRATRTESQSVSDRPAAACRGRMRRPSI